LAKVLRANYEAGSRDKDENKTCQEGYQKKQRMRQENQEDTEAKVDSARADHFFKQHPSKRIKR
jgi:hypothetical protein